MLRCQILFSMILPFATYVLIYGTLSCESAKTELYFDDITVEYMNESYVDLETFDVSLVYKPDGKNAISMHADLLKDIPDKISLKCKVSSQIFGNYIPTGLSVDSELCSGVGRIYYEIVSKPLGFYSCPPKKGSYHKEEYMPDLAGLNIKINMLSGTHLLFDMTTYVPGGIEIFRLKAYLVL